MDYTGKVFNNWRVLGPVSPSDSGRLRWKCLCVCGTIKDVLIASLKSNRSKSCGCIGHKTRAEKKTKHAMARTPTYKSWHAMLQRCEGKGGHDSYKERGIVVCSFWQRFENFYADMGTRPEGKTLDRIDNTKGYFKENCQWATYKEQSNNRDNTVMVTVDNNTMPLMYALKKYNKSETCIRHRLRKGMSQQDAFTLPLQRTRKIV